MKYLIESENWGKIYEVIENKKLEKAEGEFKFFINKVRKDIAESTWENVQDEEEAQLILKNWLWFVLILDIFPGGFRNVWSHFKMKNLNIFSRFSRSRTSFLVILIVNNFFLLIA